MRVFKTSQTLHYSSSQGPFYDGEMTKPWEERWEVFSGSIRRDWEGDRRADGEVVALGDAAPEVRALLAAAPAMVRVLAALERVSDGSELPNTFCAACGTRQWDDDPYEPPSSKVPTRTRHRPDCALHAALTAAGVGLDARVDLRRR